MCISILPSVDKFFYQASFGGRKEDDSINIFRQSLVQDLYDNKFTSLGKKKEKLCEPK